jgi:hypothetical protein
VRVEERTRFQEVNPMRKQALAAATAAFLVDSRQGGLETR